MPEEKKGPAEAEPQSMISQDHNIRSETDVNSKEPRGFVETRNHALSDDAERFISALGARLDPQKDQKLIFSRKADARGQANGFPPLTVEKMRGWLRNSDLKATSWYVGMSAVRLHGGEYRNKMVNFACLVAVVLDDVGTKGLSYEETYEKLPPSAVIESSDGNWQFFYFLDEPCEDYSRAARLIQCVYGSNLTDGGGRLVLKLARMPMGVRNKVVDGVYDDFDVRLVELDESRRYSMEELEAQFPPTRARLDEAPGDDGLPSDQVSKVLLSEHFRQEHEARQEPDGSVTFICPWWDTHTHKEKDRAIYFPLGLGRDLGEKARRAVRCHHDHCRDRSGDELAQFLFEGRYSEGMRLYASGEFEYTLRRYEPLIQVAEVYDSERRISIPISGFERTHRHTVPTYFSWNEAGDQPDITSRVLHSAWSLHKSKQGRAFDKTSFKADAGLFFDASIGGVPLRLANTFQPIVHVPPRRRRPSRAFVRMLRHLFPDRAARRRVLAWVVNAVQKPWSRQWMLLIISKEEGTGKSTFGDMVKVLFKHAGGETTWRDITDQWDNWAHRKAFVLNDELKEERRFSGKSAVEEKLKIYNDSRVREHEFNYKGSKQHGWMYVKMMSCSNHDDALVLVNEARRVGAEHATSEKLSKDLHAECLSYIDDEQAIADTWHWLQSLDVQQLFPGFNPGVAPETGAKARMKHLNKSDVKLALEHALQVMPGDVCTKKQLREWLEADENLDFTDSRTRAALNAVVREFWSDDRNFIAPKTTTGGGRLRITGESGRPYIRIIRNHGHWRKMWKSDVPNDVHAEEAKKNHVPLQERKDLMSDY
ncbi:DUF5906 domain-containing protein [Pseudooceanicola sp. LIPI14-2-Ac024]|uniref:DUF5906 domain-containing protein n=1 Tax=Pseudooceanicola sp. LIPI14-2-Ac024 TaxID=3344875 RepID=UPI0035CFFC99